MPRPNRPRSIASESALAHRIAYEREVRGMTPAGLASRMTQAGCPINASAIYKIEKADPPRRITVDELVAFSEVFGIGVEDLLLPPEVAMDQTLRELVLAWNQARLELLPLVATERAAWEELRRYVRAHPKAAPALVAVMHQWAAENFEEGARVDAFALRLTQLTHDGYGHVELSEDGTHYLLKREIDPGKVSDGEHQEA
jgi:transcriptional regulator with XRE-family HTH domain